ncbi:MAG: VCBS repeat-containing protein [Saprospiraceae bacterium]
MYSRWFVLILANVILFSCKQKSASPDTDTLFKLIPSSYSHIDFANNLKYDRNFNIYKYRNFYNGGGVAIGDINHDSLPDIYFTSNMAKNKLYLNKGNFHFEDISAKAGVQGTKAWSTGVSMADVNGDGWLDIYVCNSGDIKGDNKENELFINQQDGTFKDMAMEYGLNDKGYSTHAAFFDFDKDGDLDMYLLNNSYKAIGSFNLRNNIRETRDTLGGDKLFRNDNNHFVDVSDMAGIYGSLIGFGLGVTVGDVNQDGWQDIYVSNDFFERDYLYINQQDGTFKEDLINEMRCTSAASMGADMADINNDGHPDIFVTDMLPSSEQRLKTKTTFEDWNKYQYNVKNGYYHQFIRNVLQLNNGDGSFSEIGRLAGVHATDWSWGALLFDMDLDGNKDIFVANGIYNDLTDQDYLSFISDASTIQNITKDDSVDYKQLIDSIPSEAIPNCAFRNEGHDFTFTNNAAAWGLGTPSFSNGSAYGDLDNDGDLDLVINNVNMPCFIYQNQATTKLSHHYLKIKLKGSDKNTLAYGSQINLYADHQKQYMEYMPIRGFESSMEPVSVFGLGDNVLIDSLIVTFPDGSIIKENNVKADQTIYIDQKNAIKKGHPLKSMSFQADKNRMAENTLFSLTSIPGIDIKHVEDDYSDFDRDRLLYQMLSNEGPKLSIGDLNGDGLDDIYMGQAKGTAKSILIQKPNGSFMNSKPNVFESSIQSEDIGSALVDIDHDGDLDLYVCSGSSEDAEISTNLMDRLYINDGKGNYTLSPQILPTFKFESTSCVRSCDFDMDGDMDLFVGVRQKPFYYGVPVNGYILINDGKGNYKTNASGDNTLKDCGLITDAAWADVNNDKTPDLIVCGEYMPVKIFLNNPKTHTLELSNQNIPNGYWNTIIATDLDHDGDIDLVAGNHGLNSRFKAESGKPIKMYVNDFDRNGSVEHLLTSYRDGQEYPFTLKHDLIAQMPVLKKKYLHYSSFAGQHVQDFFPEVSQSTTLVDSVTWLRTSILLNDGKGNFSIKPLPVEAQFSPVYAIYTDDFNHDGLQDILLGGNQYRTKPETGRYDASYGLIMIQSPDHSFHSISAEASGIHIIGEVRDIKPIHIKGKKYILVARNNDSPLTYSLR